MVEIYAPVNDASFLKLLREIIKQACKDQRYADAEIIEGAVLALMETGKHGTTIHEFATSVRRAILNAPSPITTVDGS